jgi:hypothetical protein
MERGIGQLFCPKPPSLAWDFGPTRSFLYLCVAFSHELVDAASMLTMKRKKNITILMAQRFVMGDASESLSAVFTERMDG